MKAQNIYQLLSIDDFSATPKYLQLANSIIKGIRQGQLELNDSLPSINELSFEFEISRDTAEKGYKYLKKKRTSWLHSRQRLFYQKHGDKPETEDIPAFQ